MKWSDGDNVKIDWKWILCFLLALAILLIELFSLTSQTSTSDFVDMRSAKRGAQHNVQSAVASVPYLSTWIHAVSRSGDPVTDTQRFVVATIPLALKIEEKYGIPAAFLLAQAVYESDRGRSILAVVGHNYFGVTWQTGRPIYVDGIAYQRFQSMADCFIQQGQLLSGKRYVSALKNRHHVEQYARAVQRLGYAPQPNYAARIREIVEDFALEEESHD